MRCLSNDGLEFFNPFICSECGFELPDYLESKFESVCKDCEKELGHHVSSYSLKRRHECDNKGQINFIPLTSVAIPF